MAKKATLDILDIKIEEIEPEKPAEDAVPEAAQGGASATYSWSLLILLKGWCRRRLFWILLLGAVSLIAVAALAFVLLYEGPAGKTPVAPGKVPATGTPAPSTDRIVLLPGFVVDLKDERGAARVIFCDAALDLEKLQKGEAGKGWIESRNLIYSILKRKKVRELLTTEDRNRLKMELREQLNGLLGENAVRNVYFTRFEVF